MAYTPRHRDTASTTPLRNKSAPSTQQHRTLKATHRNAERAQGRATPNGSRHVHRSSEQANSFAAAAPLTHSNVSNSRASARKGNAERVSTRPPFDRQRRLEESHTLGADRHSGWTKIHENQPIASLIRLDNTVRFTFKETTFTIRFR